jgi:uncharacterized protein with HEPN domain
MSPTRASADALADILDAIQKVAQFVSGMTYEQFSVDTKTLFAVVRALEIIGEATKSVPQSVKDNNPDMPWREMAGMRDVLIHAYFGVNPAVVWKTACNDVPGLEPGIRRIMAEPEQR